MARSVPPAVPVVERYAFSPAEAADAIGVSRQHIYNMLASGELRSVKIGRSRRIPASELARLCSIDPDRA